MVIADYLKVLSDTNTLRIFNFIKQTRLCVCELELLTDLKQSNLSRHLSKLSKAGVISREKEAQWVYYSVSEAFTSEHDLLIQYLDKQFMKDLIFTEDNKKLSLFKENGIGCTNITDFVNLLKEVD